MNAMTQTESQLLQAAVADHRALRFLTAGSVDDGKSTLIGRLLFDSRAILADQLDVLEKRAAGAAHRPVAADRRPGGRARTRHHHRRGLPLLRHQDAQVHHRRRPGPRAVHPQHGDGRGRQRRRRGAGRHHQDRPDTPCPSRCCRRPAAMRCWPSCCACPASCSRSTSSTRWPTRRRLCRHPRRPAGLCRAGRHQRGGHHPGVGPARRQRHPAAGRRLVRRPVAAAGAGAPARRAGAHRWRPADPGAVRGA